MNEPTYSQIEAACEEFSNALMSEDSMYLRPSHSVMKAALMAAQKVDSSVYGHMHFGFSCGGVNLQTDSAESMKQIKQWHHDSTSTLPYYEKHVIPELKQLRAQVRRQD